MSDPGVGTDRPTSSGGRAPLLDDQLCFDLFVASQAVVKAYEPALGALGLSYQQYLVLLALWEINRPCPIAELARRLRMEPQGLLPVLRRMITSGLLVRDSSPADTAEESQALVSVAERAQQLQSPITDVHCTVKDSLGLSPHEFRALQSTLRAVSSSADPSD